jgi:hypothetical protein
MKFKSEAENAICKGRWAGGQRFTSSNVVVFARMCLVDASYDCTSAQSASRVLTAQNGLDPDMQ